MADPQYSLFPTLATKERRRLYDQQKYLRLKTEHPDRLQARRQREYAQRRAERYSRTTSCRQCLVKALKQAGFDPETLNPLAPPDQEAKKAHARAMKQAERARYRAKYPEKHAAAKRASKIRRKTNDPEGFRVSKRLDKAKRRAAGSLTAVEWHSIKRLYNFRCAYCGKKGKDLTMDHVVPVAKGGKTERENIVPACMTCNNRKKTKKAPVHQMVMRLEGVLD